MPIRPASLFGRKAPLFSQQTNDYYFGGVSGKIDLSSTEMLLQRTGSEAYETFHNDPIGLGLRSTQQVPLDWAQFSNHTFFNSAEANVNMAFNTIINEFPFDGSRDEIRQFLDSLTGFEKWVYDSFPKNKGYLKFDGAAHIAITDRKGYFSPELSRQATGAPVLDPQAKSITFEMDLFAPGGVDLDCATVFQKVGDSGYGFSGFLSESAAGSSNIDFVATVNSGSVSMSAAMQLERGQFHHIACVFNRTPGVDRIQLIRGGRIVASSSTSTSLGRMGFLTASLLIGSGVAQNTPSGVQFVPKQPLSGALDDLRIFHEARTPAQVKAFSSGTVYPTEEPNLVFLHRYNEPTGSYSGNNIVLDSSGNGLHGSITNFSTALRTQDLPVDSGMTQEVLSLSPVLFPAFADTVALNSRLLGSASNYDANNPSLITKLIPRHLLLEATQYEGFDSEEANTGDAYTSNGSSNPIPGSGRIGSPQLISAFLFTMAKSFDEYKIFLDHFSKLLTVSYDSEAGVSDQLINFSGEYNGLEGAPFVYQLLSAAQYYNGANLTDSGGESPASVKHVAAQMMRRVLVNYQDIVRSKGTRHSIEAVFRALGINPDTSIRIREFGGAARRSMSETRRKIAEVRTAIQFSGTLGPAGTLDAQGFDDSRPHFSSPFLSGSRTEPGFPRPSAVPGNDGLFTTSSFTVETLVRFPGLATGSYSGTQSVVRLHVTGSGGNLPMLNLLVVSESLQAGVTGSVQLFGRTIDDATQANVIQTVLTGVNVFDGNDWYLSFGRDKGTDAAPFLTSSYFLRAGLNRFGAGLELYSNSVIFDESVGGKTDLLSNVTASANASGSFIVVGSQSLPSSNAGLANTTAVTDPAARTTAFEGQFAELRFWSKRLDGGEFREHVMNPRSVGVIDPLTNYNFVTDQSGSFGRLRLDVSTDQPVTQSDVAGQILLTDFSQNFAGSLAAGFEPSARVIVPRRRDFTIIDPKFDERSVSNRVRIRSFQDSSTAVQEGVAFAPIHELGQDDEPQDDTRVSIEVSIARGLDEDIVNILATLEAIERAIGKPQALYSETYKDLDKLRDVYFNRLTGKINFQEFFEIYNWFDTSIGQFIAQMLPTRSDFLGTNFVFESHALERHKIAYKDFRQYLKPSQRSGDVEEDAESSKYQVDTITGQLIG